MTVHIQPRTASSEKPTIRSCCGMDVHQHRRVEVNGIGMNVLVAGSGPDVLLVHGFPDSHEVWRKQIPALVAAGYRVIAADTRGCGDSDMSEGVRSYRVDNLVGDLVALLDHLNVRKVRLVGHDWGAAISWQLALSRPERVDRYVAMSVGHPTAYAKAPLEQKIKGYYILVLQLRGVIEWALKLGHWWLLRLMTQYPEELPRWTALLSRPGRLTAAINYYRANLGLILPKIFPKARVPVMGIWSDGDIVLSESQMLATRDYVDAPFRYCRIQGANHWLQLTAPEKVNALLLDYLK